MTEHWSSDDLEADADAKASGQRLSDQVDAFNRSVAVNAAQRIDARYNASTPQPPQELPHDAGTQSGRSTQANVDSQAGPTQNGPDATVSEQSALGGARCALDMTDERDRGMVRESLKRGKKRWAGVDDAFKAEMVAGLKEAAAIARECIATRVDPLDAAKVIASVVRTAVAIEDQCQKDEHRADDMARIDAGKPTTAVKLYAHDAPTHAV